jgi:FtsH-binding integral membrane protein
MLGYDLRALGSVLFVTLIGLILLRLFSGKKYTEIIIPLFALFVVYDTNNILRRNYEGNFVGASFDYFADILNLFSALLEKNE